jgi:hypothetical protein
MNFLRMRTSSSLKKNRNPRASIAYRRAHSIGIIFSVEDRQKHDEVKDFIRQLEQDGKNVRVLEFLPQKKENYEFLFDFFTVDELSFWGKITSATALKFIETPFDYLFYIDQQSNPLVLNLMAQSRAHCRIGKYAEADSPFYELMIEHQGTVKGLIDNMYKYTKLLR